MKMMLKIFYMHLLVSSLTTFMRCQKSALPIIAYEKRKCASPINASQERHGSIEECGKSYFENPELCPGKYFDVYPYL